MIVYCDMDGVLTDFDSRALEIVNKHLASVTVPGSHKLADKVKEDLGDSVTIEQIRRRDHRELKKLIFRLIPTDEFFWKDLEWLDERDKLWDPLQELCDSFNVKLRILSSPLSSDLNCEKYKREWCKEQLSKNREDVIIKSEKQEEAMGEDGPNILIDDTQKKISLFTEAGGLGFLYKRNYSNALDFVEKALIKHVDNYKNTEQKNIERMQELSGL
jgi:hypothetical protein